MSLEISEIIDWEEVESEANIIAFRLSKLIANGIIYCIKSLLLFVEHPRTNMVIFIDVIRNRRRLTLGVKLILRETTQT